MNNSLRSPYCASTCFCNFVPVPGAVHYAPYIDALEGVTICGQAFVRKGHVRANHVEWDNTVTRHWVRRGELCTADGTCVDLAPWPERLSAMPIPFKSITCALCRAMVALRHRHSGERDEHGRHIWPDISVHDIPRYDLEHIRLASAHHFDIGALLRATA